MKKIGLILLIFIFCSNIGKAQNTYNKILVESVIEARYYPAYYDYIFIYKELIEIYKQDTSKLKTDITNFSFQTYGKPCLDYYFNCIKFLLKEKLLEHKEICSKQEDIVILNKLIYGINIDSYPVKPELYENWGDFYNCFFEDPGDEKDFSIFTLIFMKEVDLLSFLSKDDALDYWKTSVILDLTVGGGDFIENSSLNGTNTLFKNKAEYILERWNKSKNPIIIQTMDAFRNALAKPEN